MNKTMMFTLLRSHFKTVVLIVHCLMLLPNLATLFSVLGLCLPWNELCLCFYMLWMRSLVLLSPFYADYLFYEIFFLFFCVFFFRLLWRHNNFRTDGVPQISLSCSNPNPDLCHSKLVLLVTFLFFIIIFMVYGVSNHVELLGFLVCCV
jgi:hypothetical protein